MITPQQLLLLLVLETGKVVFIVPTAVMGAVAVVLQEVVGILDIIVNAYLLVFVKIWQEINVNSNDILCLLEDFGRSLFNNPFPTCVVGDWCVY